MKREASPSSPSNLRKKINIQESDYEEYESQEKVNADLKLAARTDCPYLDTIDRQLLDFDADKVCSVTSSNLHVYACLCCGKFFQGRAAGSPAYFHALQVYHHVFIHLNNRRIYCLPDGYEVMEPSLKDIQYNIRPFYELEEIQKLDSEEKIAFDLNNRKYLPGFIGLNNAKAHDYVNVVVHALAHVSPLRDYFLLWDPSDLEKRPLARAFGDLVRKIWNAKSFRTHVNPHEFLQVVSNASQKRFVSTKQGDAGLFMAWLLNSLHAELLASQRKQQTMIHRLFQGQLTQQTIHLKDDLPPSVTDLPFLFLTLDLPPVPLYKDELDVNIIPQVALETLLQKFNGHTEKEEPGCVKRYALTQLPNYLILNVKRFSKNAFKQEKNPTIVTFPIDNLTITSLTSQGTYRLVANITHETGKEDGSGVYKVHVLNKASQHWYSIYDLEVTQVLPQMIFLAEAYIQIWERTRLAET